MNEKWWKDEQIKKENKNMHTFTAEQKLVQIKQ